MEQRQNFGSTVGRYIGRILNARFTLDGVEYKLVPNNGKSGHISVSYTHLLRGFVCLCSTDSGSGLYSRL